MLFNFAWLYNFALKDYINISQQEVFGILFPDLYVRDSLPDIGDCSNRISGKLPLTKNMILSLTKDKAKIECRIENLHLSDFDEICKRIFFMLIDEEFSLEDKKKDELISMYKRITFSANRESQIIDSRLCFIAESLKTAANQSSAKLKSNNQEWVLCQDKELDNYKNKYVNADFKRLDEANTENIIGYERTLSVGNQWTSIIDLPSIHEKGIDSDVLISVNSSSQEAKIDIRMLDNVGDVVWSQKNTFPVEDQRNYWCGPDVYKIELRITNGEGIVTVCLPSTILFSLSDNWTRYSSPTDRKTHG